jgi:glycosyltransferase involved in cell wall biosynthesis
MVQPLVSILIPVYNAEAWLAETLNSALAQTWPRKEIIVVDDGSTDNSLRIARGFQSKQLSVTSQSNRGQTAALNQALVDAQGELIQYLDADDLLVPNKIEIQAERLLAEEPDTLATAKWARFYNNDVSTAVFPQHADFRDYNEPIEWLLQAWNGRGTMPPVAWLFPRGVVEKTGPWNEQLTLCNDTEYFTRAVLNSRKIAFCAEAQGFYRSGNASLSGRKDRKALESYFRVCELCVEELLAAENSSRTRRASASLWQFFAYQTYPDAPDLVRLAEEKVADLDGTDLRFGGSTTFRFVRGVGGWKTAKRLQKLFYQIRY